MKTVIQHQWIDINGVKLHVATAGKEEGPAILFLHGFPEFWYGWKQQIDYFVDQGYFVIVPDQRGYNLSDKPAPVSDYRMDLLAQDVVQLLTWAKRNKVVLVGHDWGAAVAWWTAIFHPEKIEKLIILNTPHPLVMKKNLKSNWKQIRKSWYIFFFQIPRLPEWLLSFGRARLVESILVASSRKGTFTEEDFYKYREAWLRPGALRAMVNWYRAVRSRRTVRSLPWKVTVPTLIIWGEKDRFLGAEMARESLTFCESAQLELIPEATHWVQHEEAQRVNHLIRSFIS